MSRGRPRKEKHNEPEEIQPELPLEPESEVVHESSPSETDLSKVPSKYHKFSKGEK